MGIYDGIICSEMHRLCNELVQHRGVPCSSDGVRVCVSVSLCGFVCMEIKDISKPCKTLKDG